MRTIVQISDLHFGTHSEGVAEDLLRSIAANAPDLVVVSGDLTQRAKHREFRQAQSFLARIPQTKIVVPGNHDVPLFNLYARFVAPFAKYEKYLVPVGGPGDFYSDDEIAVLGINTARRFTRKNGRVSREQIAEMARVFQSAPQNVLKILVTHHPLGVPAGEPSMKLVGRWRLAADAISSAGVHLLLSGHYHRSLMGSTAEVADGGSILILHAGTALSSRVRGDGNSFNVIRIDGEAVSVRVLQWATAEGFSERQSFSYRLEGRGWRRI